MKNRFFPRNKLFIAILLSVTVFIVVGYLAYSRYKTGFQISFGAEYGAIAETLLEGKGYSNPFYFDSGPTAWMPPALVFLIYFVFLIFGNGYTGFFVLTGIKITAYTLSAFMAIKLLGIEKDRKNLVIFLLLFFLYLAFSANENFGMIIDLWLIVFLQTAFLYALNFYDKTRSGKYIFWLIILMFFMPLVSPGITLASVVLVFLYALCKIWCIFKSIPGHGPVSTYLRAVFIFAPRQWSLTPFILMGVSFMISISLWTYRNYRVFNEIIPTKSNLPFEFYLSNVKDYDGVLSTSTLELYHPNRNPEMIPEIKTVGEVKWIEKYRTLNKAYLKENKTEYLKKVLNRFINAYLFTSHDRDNIPVKAGLTFLPGDQHMLDSLGLIRKGEWMCLTLSEKEFMNKLDRSTFNNRGVILDRFRDARRSLRHRIYSPANVFRSLMMSLIPALCMVFLFFRNPVNRSREFTFLVISYNLYLLIYVIVSHHLRYQKPLFLLQILLIILCLKEIQRMIRPAGSDLTNP